MGPHRFGKPGRSCRGAGKAGRFRAEVVVGDRERSELAMTPRENERCKLRSIVNTQCSNCSGKEAESFQGDMKGVRIKSHTK